MKRITAKVITISSQILVVSLFLISIFLDNVDSDEVTVVNNNFDKMSDNTSILFVEEDNSSDKIDGNVTESLDEDREKEVYDNVIETYTGILTGYGPDCVGCGNFNTGKVSTASGYHISNIVNGAIEPAFTITYNDSEYGEVRIVAADSKIPFYSIVRITVPGWDPIVAIVLDRGSTVGFENCRSSRGCLTNFDLLYPTEAESLGKTRDVKFELLRNGK